MVAGDVYEYYRLRRKALRQEYNNANSICISYPKCGRTWLRYVLGNYFHLKYNVENTHVLNTIKRKWRKRKKKNCPLVSFTHDNHSFISEPMISEINLSLDNNFIFEKIYNKKKLIFLMRDPIDASISYYKMCKNITGVFIGSIQEWFNHPIFGLDAVTKWYQLAYDLYKCHPNAITVHYENLKNNQYEWEKLIRFITDDKVNEEWLQNSLQKNNFQKKKEEEMSQKGIFDPNDDRLFVRQGGKNYQNTLPHNLQSKINDHKQLYNIKKCVESMV